MPMKTDKPTALIFDLGGVIINLDIQRTIDQLARYAQLDARAMVDLYWGDPLFHQYEKGQISDQSFRDGLRALLNVDISDQAVDAAWNAMILDIPKERLDLLQTLKEDYQLFLLSNTNNIHLKRVFEVFQPAHHQQLDDYFQQAYYSHKTGMRKPDAEIYKKVLSDHKLAAAKTLFLDDNQQNIEGAQAVGLQTFKVENPNQLKEIFDGEKI